MSGDLFSPKINMKLPKINSEMPQIKVTDEQDLLFEVDGTTVSIDDVADKFSSWYLDS